VKKKPIIDENIIIIMIIIIKISGDEHREEKTLSFLIFLKVCITN
jgi:hypothetical protein